MNSITVEYRLEHEEQKPYLCLKVRDSSWAGGRLAAMFGEVAEGMLHTSYDRICVDLAGLSLVSSGVFGACVNIVESARQNGKNVKFRFNAAAMETAKMASFDKLATIELGEADPAP